MTLLSLQLGNDVNKPCQEEDEAAQEAPDAKDGDLCEVFLN